MSLLGLALLVRALMPSGWMPTGEKAFAITVCTGIDTQQVWITRDGAIHKSDPSKKEHKQGDGGGKGCTFAATGLPMLAAVADGAGFVAAPVETMPLSAAGFVAVGRGLAAPPPPSTGPPIPI